MKIKHREVDRTERNLFAAAFLFLIILLVSSCGEVVSLEQVDTGAGGAYSLMLSWTAPTTNVDGTPLEDLAGYKLHYGPLPGSYSQVVNVGDFTTAELAGFGSGTYYIAVTAYDIYGNESEYSNEINQTFF